MSKFLNIDCMIGMKEYPDKYFELAIVDIPYGLKIGDNGKLGGNKKIGGNEKIPEVRQYKEVKWDDKTPEMDYFIELFRISNNQIIWGGNYITDKMETTNGWILWDKKCKNDWEDNFSDGEMAWSSFDQPLRIYRHLWMGALRKIEFDEAERIHPTQKPIALYKWLLTKYAKQGDKILDTHVGSASSLIACEDLGFEYVGFELDEDYYKAACKRLEQFRSQLKLFNK